jgi:urease accessory protein
VFTSTFGGGLVDGDRLSMDVEIGAGAMALVATQASTKIYRSQEGTRSEVRARVASGGLLAVLPDPIVCFAGSRYRQRQQFDLAESASLVVLDWMTAGRRAAGERWVFDEYVAKIVITTEGRLRLHDVLALRAADGDLPSRLGRFDVMAIAIVVGDAVASHAAAIVSRVSGQPIEGRVECIAAATPIEGGCVLRVAGRSLEQVACTLRAHLAFVPALLGDDPWARKW